MKKWMGYVLVILWLAAAVRYIAGGEMSGESRVAYAFADADFQRMEYSLSLAGYLDGEAYGEEGCREFLEEIAHELGMYTQYTVTSESDGRMKRTEITKEMTHARVCIRMVRTENGISEGETIPANYLYIRLDFDQSPDSALTYKRKLEQIRETYGLDSTVTLKMTGVYEGELDREAKDAAAEQLLASMGADEQEAHRSEDLYTVYAYTEDWPEYTVVNGKRVNLNLAFSYDEAGDRTWVYAGSPMILDEY